ncbi:MAG: winged helix-turn-helix transcriptional regulator, partial [Pseudomonadota bacterium]
MMSTFPKPGSPVRGSKSGAPVMALFDLLGRSWSMGALWQLCEHGPTTFRGLQDRCEAVSPTVLNRRLKELRHAGLIDRGENGYEATMLGLELYQLL